MTYRFYRSTTLGDGTSTQNAIRAKLTQYIVNDGTMDFSDWSYRVRSARYCFAQCPHALHDTIEADTDITVLSPELADIAAVNAWLDGLVGTLPPAIETLLENDGFPVDWITGATTRRQLWRLIALQHVVVQRLSGSGDADLQSVFVNGLATTASQLSAAARTKVRNWMTDNGIDSSWIVGSTTLREVIKFIAANRGGLPILKFDQAINLDD